MKKQRTERDIEYEKAEILQHLKDRSHRWVISKELQKLLQIEGSIVRKRVRSLRFDNEPVVSTNIGYRYTLNPYLIEKFIERNRSQADEMYETSRVAEETLNMLLDGQTKTYEYYVNEKGHTVILVRGRHVPKHLVEEIFDKLDKDEKRVNVLRDKYKENKKDENGKTIEDVEGENVVNEIMSIFKYNLNLIELDNKTFKK